MLLLRIFADLATDVKVSVYPFLRSDYHLPYMVSSKNQLIFVSFLLV